MRFNLMQSRDAIDVLGRINGLAVFLVVDGLDLTIDGCRVDLLDVVLCGTHWYKLTKDKVYLHVRFHVLRP